MIQKTTKVRFTKFTFCFLSLLLLFPIYSFKTVSQSDSFEDVIPFEQTDEIPLFKGCDDSNSRKESVDCFNQKMMNHIKRNFNYPEDALESNIQGKVDITFIINESGLIKDIKTSSQDKSGLLEEEAARIISSLPKFQPGKHKGKIVSVKYGVPIIFKLG